jgi:hypothetical protein
MSAIMGPAADARKCLDCVQPFEATRARQRRCGRCIRIRVNERRLEAKTEALAHYGGGMAACANPFAQHDKPYTDNRALTLDYVTGGHGKTGLPRGRQLYRKLRREGWPLGWQVLCCNCQLIKVFEKEEQPRKYKRKGWRGGRLANILRRRIPKVKVKTSRHGRTEGTGQDQSGAS